jgi:Lhr-like helicase
MPAENTVNSLSSFHPAVRRWFSERLGEPTECQNAGWPAIASGAHALIAAPTGGGKTLAAFLWALSDLFGRGEALEDRTNVLYVSPLRALSNDVQKNLQGPLREIRDIDPSLPELRVLVRTGDTTSSERSAMMRRPPHILVTTPESLYLMLTSDGGRGMLETVGTVIVDEIHALYRDKRGSHLALSLERLERLTGRPVQRIGLSATQKPWRRSAGSSPESGGTAGSSTRAPSAGWISPSRSRLRRSRRSALTSSGRRSTPGSRASSGSTARRSSSSTRARWPSAWPAS